MTHPRLIEDTGAMECWSDARHSTTTPLPCSLTPLLLTALLCVVTGPVRAASMSPGRAFLDRHCVECHDAEVKKGGLDLTALTFDPADTASFDRWVKVHDKVRDGEMPPKKKPQPEAKERAAFLASLAQPLADADRARQAERGRTIVRRLNRTEYQNALADLLHLPLNIRDSLPPDATFGGFDTVGAALNVSSVQVESYLDALDAAFDMASIFHEQPERKKYRLSYLQNLGMMQIYRKNQPALPQADGMAMFATEKMSHMHAALDHYLVPHDGRYKVRVSAYAIRSREPVTLTVRAGGTGHKENLDVPQQLLRYASVSEGAPQVVEWEGPLFRGQCFHIYPALRPMRFIGDFRQEDYRGPGIVVQWVEVDGPIFDEWPPASHQRLWGGVPLKPIPGAEPNENPNAQLDGPPTQSVTMKFPVKGKRDNEGRVEHRYEPRPHEKIYRPTRKSEPLNRTLALAPANPKADAARLVRSFVAAAYRRPVTDADAQPFIALAHRWLDDGQTFENALRTAYKAVLTSPDFLYFQKPAPKLDEHALAERLAFFLTRLPQDAELRALASAGKLSQPATLRAQTERLLNDPRSANFIHDFAAQWLDLQLIDFTSPDSDLYPEFEPVLQWSMVEETRAFLRELVTRDLPVRHIADSDFAMLNDRLAKLYGIPGVRGAEVRRVSLPKDSVRGGVLTQGSVLKVTANGTTTSPVIRGKWVLERILGVHPEPPPPGVPAIEPDIRGAITVMDQLKQHRSVESCATCHAKIDPPGVALECFDVMGAYRTTYRALDPAKADVKVRYGPEAPPEQKWKPALPVVATDTLASGERFADIREFKRLLAAQPERLAGSVVEKLILFSTGAEISFADRAEVARIVAATRNNEHGIRSLIHEVVQSSMFVSR